MKDKFETVAFNYDPFGASNIVESLNAVYEKVERCYSSPYAPYKFIKDNKVFVANPDGTLIDEKDFDSFEIYGNNFFVGKRKSEYILFDFRLKTLCTSNAVPIYLGWRIIACQTSRNRIKLYNPYGEILSNYDIREVRKFGEYGTYCSSNKVSHIFATFEITDPSTFRGLYGLINIYGEVVLSPEYDIIEFDNNGNIKASKQERIYNGKWHSTTFDRFMQQTPAFLHEYKSFYTLSQNLYAVANNDGETGVVNSQNMQVVPFEYEHIWGLDNGLVLFRKAGENGVIRLCDKKILASSSTYAFELRNGEIICRSNHHKYAMFHSINNINIDWYDEIEHLFNNYFKVRKYKKYGIINSKGEIIIDTDYEWVFISKKLILLIKGYNFSYKDMSGGNPETELDKHIYGDEITILSKEFIPLTNYAFYIKSIERTEISTYIIKTGNGVGVLDSYFNIIIPPICEWIRYSEYEYISDKGKYTLDGRFVFEDENVCKIISRNYSYCERMSNGNFIFLKYPEEITTSHYWRRKYGVLNKDFEEIIPAEYQKVHTVDYDNLFIAQSFDNKWGVIDTNNSVIIKIIFDFIILDKDAGIFVVKKNSNYGLYRVDGTEIMSCQCMCIGKQSENYRVFFRNNVWGIVNTSNGVIISFPNANFVGCVKNNILMINTGGDLKWNMNVPSIHNGKWGYMDVLGNILIPCIYEGAKNISQKLATVKKDGKWGVVKLDNDILIPFDYKEISIADKTMCCYIDDYKYDIYNLKGEKIGNGEDKYYNDPYDPDPWGAKSELDYIINNGGDWILDS